MSNVTPIQTLKVGDKVKAGDFEVLLTEVKPLGNGWFAGKGQTTLNIFQAAKMVVAFQRVRFNSDRRLIEGEMAATGGVSVIPNEWKEKYLSFAGEINRVFDEIEKGLSTVGAVMGKIDEVLKKIDEWLVNYQGEDKEELLETIRIGKKEIKEGKEHIKDGKVGDGLQKLKDGSGKVLGVGSKVLAKRLQELVSNLKQIIKEAINDMRGGSQKNIIDSTQKKEEQEKLISETAAQLEQAKEKIIVGEQQTNPSDTGIVVLAIEENGINLFLNEQEVEKRKKGKYFSKWQTAQRRVSTLITSIKVENIKFDTLSKMDGPQIIETLKGNIEKDLKELGSEILERFLKGDGYAEMKKFVITFINDKLDERIKVFYKKD